VATIQYKHVDANKRVMNGVSKLNVNTSNAGKAANLLVQSLTVGSLSTEVALIQQADVMLAQYVEAIRKRDGAVCLAAVLQLVLADIVQQA
jgi:hypothetical protein